MQRSHDRKRVLLYSGSSMYTVWKKEKQVNENKRNRWMGTRETGGWEHEGLKKQQVP